MKSKMYQCSNSANFLNIDRCSMNPKKLIRGISLVSIFFKSNFPCIDFKDYARCYDTIQNDDISITSCSYITYNTLERSVKCKIALRLINSSSVVPGLKNITWIH